MTGTEANDGVDSLNAMLATWAASKLAVPAIVQETFPTVVGQASYTLGESAADVSTVRPDKVLTCYLRASDNIDYTVEIIGREKYNEIWDKNQSYRPYNAYYNPSYPNGTLYFDSKPTAVETAYIDTQKALGVFTIDQTITLPTTYYELIPYQLAIRLAPEYGLQAPTDVYNIATAVMANIKANNSEPFEVELDFALINRNYDRKYDHI